jgi:hypothetical protein
MNDPFARLPVVPMSGIFEVPGGKDLSPQLSWSGAPAETRELHRDHVRPRRAQRVRLLALGRRRYPRLRSRPRDARRGDNL